MQQMNDVQLKKIIAHQNKNIKKAIEINVNGKIDKIDQKLTTYIIEDTNWKNDAQKYREEKLQPLIETTDNVSWMGKFIKAGLGLVILIGGAIAIIGRYI